MAEIEHFVNPKDKAHPKFKNVAAKELVLFPNDDQLGSGKTRVMAIGGWVGALGRRVPVLAARASDERWREGGIGPKHDCGFARLRQPPRPHVPRPTQGMRWRRAS